jgi:cardiolipin synthase
MDLCRSDRRQSIVVCRLSIPLSLGTRMKRSQYFNSSNTATLARGGKDYFDRLLKLIAHAKHVIHIQIYIFGEDRTGRLVADALKEAVERKVSVYLLVDGYASQALSRKFVQDLTDAGIHFRFFEPLFKSSRFYFGRRLHHKIVVADGQHALVGGLNIADRYNDLPGHPAWLDFAVETEGAIARQLHALCWRTWNGFMRKKEKEPVSRLALPDIPESKKVDIRMRRNDWVRRRNQISYSYIQMLKNARSEVVILCSYFLPGKQIRKQIRRALKRGVSIKVIAAGVSDVVLAKEAERWLYDWMLRYGIELYEYQKTVLHGKLAVCDDTLTTIGSYNVNNLSAYASIELNLDIRNEGFTKQTRKILEKIINEDCILVTPEHHKKTRNIFRQFFRWFSYQFLRVLLFVFTFYFRRG